MLPKPKTTTRPFIPDQMYSPHTRGCFDVFLRCLLILIILSVASAAWGKTTPTAAAGDTQMRQRIIAEAEQMKKTDPEKYQDFINVATHIRKENRKQHGLVSVIVAKAITDHVHDNFRYRSAEHRLNFLSLLMGIMKIESGYNPRALSNKNARGLMQVHYPTWGRYFNSQQDAHTLHKNLAVGTGILRLYLNKSNNNLRRALLMYLGASPSSTKGEYNQYVDNVVYSAIKFKKNYTVR